MAYGKLFLKVLYIRNTGIKGNIAVLTGEIKDLPSCFRALLFDRIIRNIPNRCFQILDCYRLIVEPIVKNFFHCILKRNVFIFDQFRNQHLFRLNGLVLCSKTAFLYVLNIARLKIQGNNKEYDTVIQNFSLIPQEVTMQQG